ncbi:MAG: hypothetical protein SF029_20890 [bacterium]|nr:hypothetical protein [bacterium]
MSKTRKRTSPKRSPAKAPVKRGDILTTITGIILALPRLTRISIAGLFALAVTLDIVVAFYLVDSDFISTMPIAFIPVVLGIVLGLAMYVLGWMTMVGTIGTVMSPNRLLLWYLGGGFLATLVALYWFLQTFAAINTPI